MTPLANVSKKLKKPKTTQYVNHCTSSAWLGLSMALMDRYAGRTQPRRLDTGWAKALTEWRIKTRTRLPRKAYALGI